MEKWLSACKSSNISETGQGRICITSPVESTPFFIPSTSLCSLFLVHLILRISPHHSHHLRSHHLSLPRPFTPDLKLISFRNPFLHSHSYSFGTDLTDMYCIKEALALFVLVSFSGYVCQIKLNTRLSSPR